MFQKNFEKIFDLIFILSDDRIFVKNVIFLKNEIFIKNPLLQRVNLLVDKNLTKIDKRNVDKTRISIPNTR